MPILLLCVLIERATATWTLLEIEKKEDEAFMLQFHSNLIIGNFGRLQQFPKILWPMAGLLDILAAGAIPKGMHWSLFPESPDNRLVID